MTYILIFLMLLSFFFFIISRFNRFSIYFLGISLSLMLGLYSSLLLISISGNYSSIGYAFGNLDRRIFYSIIQNRTNYFSVIRLFNISRIIYPITLFLFAMSYFRTKKFLYANILLFLFGVFEMFFYDPNVVARIYFASVGDESGLFYMVISIFDLIIHIVQILLTTLPFIYFFKLNHIQTIYKKRQLYGLLLFVILTDSLYYSIIKISSLFRLYIGKEPYSLIQIRTYGALVEHEYLIYLVLMFICTLLLFFIVQKFYLIRTNGAIDRFFLKNRSLRINKNILGIFHAVKNVIYSYKITIDVILKMDEPQKTEALKELSSTINEYVNHMSLMTKSNTNIDNLLLEKTNISSIITAATKSTPPPKNVCVNFVMPSSDLQVYVDMYYLEMAISNILRNAYDAIAESKQNGKVSIKLFSEFDSVVIAISDTGPGVNKKTKSHMFKPFYTTKSRISNWGIGLSFTKRIIQAHNGHITVHSPSNNGTEICIILPCA